jgi:hypothetical protein
MDDPEKGSAAGVTSRFHCVSLSLPAFALFDASRSHRRVTRTFPSRFGTCSGGS